MKRIGTLLLFAVVILAIMSMSSCSKVMKINGIVTGDLRNEAGGPPPMMGVQIVDLEIGKVLLSHNASDSGNFLINEVEPGHYRLAVIDAAGREWDYDNEEAKDFELKPGKTVNLGIIKISPPKQEQ